MLKNYEYIGVDSLDFKKGAIYALDVINPDPVLTVYDLYTDDKVFMGHYFTLNAFDQMWKEVQEYKLPFPIGSNTKDEEMRIERVVRQQNEAAKQAKRDMELQQMSAMEKRMGKNDGNLNYHTYNRLTKS